MRKIRQAKNSLYHFSPFEKRRETAEMPFRLGFELHSYKIYANLNIPLLIRCVARVSSIKSTQNKNIYGIHHITGFRIGKFFRTGFDTYKGEFAILLPLIKLWFQCDYLSNEFRQFGKFSIVIFLLKIKCNEFTFRIGLFGF